MAIAYLFSPGAVSSPSNPPGRFKVVAVKNHFSWLYEPTENELLGSDENFEKCDQGPQSY